MAAPQLPLPTSHKAEKAASLSCSPLLLCHLLQTRKDPADPAHTLSWMALSPQYDGVEGEGRDFINVNCIGSRQRVGRETQVGTGLQIVPRGFDKTLTQNTR